MGVTNAQYAPCFARVSNADRNSDERIGREEYVKLIDMMTGTTSSTTLNNIFETPFDALATPFQDAFALLSCKCLREQETPDSSCCGGPNAYIKVTGVSDPSQASDAEMAAVMDVCDVLAEAIKLDALTAEQVPPTTEQQQRPGGALVPTPSPTFGDRLQGSGTSIDQCIAGIAIADENDDSNLNTTEYTSFVNVLSDDDYRNTTFDDLPQVLTENFATLTGSNDQIDVFGYIADQQPTQEQEDALALVCMLTSQAILDARGNSTPMPIAPTVSPTPLTDARCDALVVRADAAPVDDALNPFEWSRFISLLVPNTYPEAFPGLPQSLQDLFIRLADSQDEFRIDGARSGSNPTQEQRERLSDACTLIDTELKLLLDPTFTLAPVTLAPQQATPQPASNQAAPRPPLSSEPTRVTVPATVYNQFVIANADGIDAAFLNANETSSERTVLDDAYSSVVDMAMAQTFRQGNPFTSRGLSNGNVGTEEARSSSSSSSFNQSRSGLRERNEGGHQSRRQEGRSIALWESTFTSTSHGRNLLVNFQVNSSSTNFFVDRPCPPSAPNQAQCQEVLASFTLLLTTDEDMPAVTTQAQDAVNVLINDESLQQVLTNVSSPFLVQENTVIINQPSQAPSSMIPSPTAAPTLFPTTRAPTGTELPTLTNFTGRIPIRSSFVISNTINLNADGLQSGANRNQLRLAYNNMAADLVQARNDRGVFFDRNSGQITDIVDTPCPVSAPLGSTCQAVYARYTINVRNDDEAVRKSQYESATRFNIRTLELQNALNAVNPNTPIMIEEGRDPTFFPTPSPTIVPLVPPEPEDNEGFFTTGTIVGILFGILVLIGLVVGYFYWSNQRRQSRVEDANYGGDDDDEYDDDKEFGEESSDGVPPRQRSVRL